MPRQTTIYAAILGEHGNADESYPRPLTCYVCGERYGKWVMHNPGPDYLWYWPESAPLPAGWQEITSDVPPAKMVYCPSCYEDRAEGRELTYDY